MRALHTTVAVALAMVAAVSRPGLAQGVDVSASIVRERAPEAQRKNPSGLPQVVMWLGPLQPLPSHAAAPQHPGPFRLVQENKQFRPHLLVIPTGTSVEFPNTDPFFHNVFSLFNGKRFDLGLYESGTTRSVSFDREGVSYIFCNIHPEMGAVVLALSTPYFAVSTSTGVVIIHNVPPGSYRLHIWSETYSPIDSAFSEQTIQVSAAPVQLGTFPLKPAADPMLRHKNKFGEDYLPSHDHAY